MRCGSSTVESTLFPLAATAASTGGANRKNDELTSIFAMKSIPANSGSRTPRAALNAALNPTSTNPAASGTGGDGHVVGAVAGLEECSERAVGLLSTLPSSDHALSYVVLEGGVSFVFSLLLKGEAP